MTDLTNLVLLKYRNTIEKGISSVPCDNHVLLLLSAMVNIYHMHLFPQWFLNLKNAYNAYKNCVAKIARCIFKGG